MYLHTSSRYLLTFHRQADVEVTGQQASPLKRQNAESDNFHRQADVEVPGQQASPLKRQNAQSDYSSSGMVILQTNFCLYALLVSLLTNLDAETIQDRMTRRRSKVHFISGCIKFDPQLGYISLMPRSVTFCFTALRRNYGDYGGDDSTKPGPCAPLSVKTHIFVGEFRTCKCNRLIIGRGTEGSNAQCFEAPMTSLHQNPATRTDLNKTRTDLNKQTVTE